MGAGCTHPTGKQIRPKAGSLRGISGGHFQDWGADGGGGSGLRSEGHQAVSGTEQVGYSGGRWVDHLVSQPIWLGYSILSSIRDPVLGHVGKEGGQVHDLRGHAHMHTCTHSHAHTCREMRFQEADLQTRREADGEVLVRGPDSQLSCPDSCP